MEETSDAYDLSKIILFFTLLILLIESYGVDV